MQTLDLKKKTKVNYLENSKYLTYSLRTKVSFSQLFIYILGCKDCFNLKLLPRLAFAILESLAMQGISFEILKQASLLPFSMRMD